MPDVVIVTESDIVTVTQGETLVTVYDGRGFPGTPGDSFDQTLNTTDAVEFSGLVNNGLTFPTADGTAGQVIETDGAGVLSFVTSTGGVSSLTAGTGISLDVTTGDITVTNSEPDQTVTLTDGAGIAVTGTYPSFTIDCDITQYTDTDARLALSAGTGISYDDTTGIITNDEPDQTVTLTGGTGITITGTYPSFTIDCDITQYTDTDARLALSAGTGISYDDTTGIITNDEPDQTVTLTGGTDIAVTGTYPSFTIDFDGVIPIAADADTAGILYGLTTDNVSGYNVSLGFGANGSLTTGNYNVALGGAAGDMTSGNYNVAIGFDCNVADPTADKQLAIGPDAYVRWITGDANMNIKPGAGLKDAVNSVGTAGQLLSSTGTAIEWVDSVTSLIAGTGISVDVSTGDVTITNDEPDQTVTLTDGTGITITGTYPSFTIDCDITQYTDTDARLALSAGTGISYDNTTGIITNDEPDQTVTLTNGTDITITGTYPSFTIAYSGTAGSGTVTKASVVSANGFAGSVATDTTTPAITISTSITGLLKGDGTAISAATSGTDYAIPSGNITGTAAGLSTTLAVTSGGTGLATLTAENVILGNGTSNPTFVAPSTSGNVLTSNGTTWLSQAPAGSGTVTKASVVSANGFAGTVATDTTTPAITISTSITGLLKGDGTAISAATSGTDYVVPSGSITGNAATVTTNASLTGPITSSGNATSIGSQTGTGNTFVMSTSPTLVTPNIGAATGTSLTLSGDLVVNGSTVTLNATTLEIVDKNITLANVATPTEITCDGSGITVKSATDHTFNYVAANTAWTSSENIDLASGKVIKFNGVSVLSSTALNKVTVTAPATGATLTIADGATLTASATASVSGTNTGDNAANTTYSSLVSNATHTGDATGDTALTVVAINGVVMSGLATGLLKNTTSTGAPSIATAGTDYVAPSGALGTPTSGTLTNCTFPTLNQNTSGSAASLSATLDVSSGGTGQITATAAFNGLAPDQTSNSGKYLKTDGTNTSWGTLPSALPVLLFGGVTTTSVSVANGSLPVLLFGGVTTVNVTVT